MVDLEKPPLNELIHYGVKGMRWGIRKKIELKDKMESRGVQKTDLKEITNLFEKLPYQERKFLALDQKYPVIRKNIRDEKHVTVSEINGNIVGFIRESGRPNGFTLLEELVVHPDYRNEGIASKMLINFHNKFPKTLAKTNAKNETMINILKKSGYKPDNPDSKRIINWTRESGTIQHSRLSSGKKIVDYLIGV